MSSRADAFVARAQRRLDDVLASAAKNYSVPLSADDTLALHMFFLKEVDSGRWGYVALAELLAVAAARVAELERRK